MDTLTSEGADQMEDEYAELRYLTRTRLGLIWDMVMAGAELEGDEAVTAEILRQHPRYFDIWERAGILDPGEEVLRDGANPFAHVAIHQTVENQIANHDPPETAETLEALMQAGYTRPRGHPRHRPRRLRRDIRDYARQPPFRRSGLHRSAPRPG
jgi:hypothetical protein